MLYYYEDLDALLVEAHGAGVERFCDQRDTLLTTIDDPRDKLGAAIDAGLPTGPDDALMSLLYEFDVLTGNSALHDELVQKMYLRQLATYTRVFAAGRAAGVFEPRLPDDDLAMTLVALEDAYGLHIVGGQRADHCREGGDRDAQRRGPAGLPNRRLTSPQVIAPHQNGVQTNLFCVPLRFSTKSRTKSMVALPFRASPS